MARQIPDTPTCPTCGASVLRTHRCTARPPQLVPMPDRFRDQVAEAMASGQRDGRTDYADTLELDLPEWDSAPGMWSR